MFFNKIYRTFLRAARFVAALLIVNYQLSIYPALAEVGELSATTGYIFDGDTFSARVNLENGADISVRVRIRNIDAPEIHGECKEEIEMANLARDRLSELLPKGTTVGLSNIKDDKYLGRIDALVSLNGRDVGEIMMDEELAREYNGGKRMSWCEGE